MTFNNPHINNIIQNMQQVISKMNQLEMENKKLKSQLDTQHQNTNLQMEHKHLLDRHTEIKKAFVELEQENNKLKVDHELLKKELDQLNGLIQNLLTSVQNKPDNLVEAIIPQPKRNRPLTPFNEKKIKKKIFNNQTQIQDDVTLDNSVDILKNLISEGIVAKLEQDMEPDNKDFFLPSSQRNTRINNGQFINLLLDTMNINGKK